MSLVLASTALLLLAAAPAPGSSSSADFRLHEGLPAGFKVDGKLDEWKVPASTTFEASSQVAGKSKVASSQDLSAQVWVAVGPEGLAVAGEVRDDQVRLSKGADQVNHDHVEVWLSLPQPVMPPIAFVNQFGENELPTPAACENNEAIADGTPEECRSWWESQAEERKKLVRAFTVQYGLMSEGLVRFDAKGTVGSIRYEPMAGGYRFEALIPPSAFPRSAEAPLRNLKVLVDLVDSDEGTGRLESFLSSSKRRRFGDPSTFHAVTLSRPLRFGAWPDLLERVLKANEGGSYQPAPDAHTLEVWINPAVGNQLKPEEASPQVVSLDLSKEKLVDRLGDVELVRVPGEASWIGETDFWIVSRRGKTLLDAQGIGTRELRITPRAQGLHILQVADGVRSPLGTGACAVCPELSFLFVKLDAQGRFSKPENMEGGSTQGQELQWEATPDLSRIQVFFKGFADDDPRQLLVRYTWDAKAGGYSQEKFEHPSLMSP